MLLGGVKAYKFVLIWPQLDNRRGPHRAAAHVRFYRHVHLDATKVELTEELSQGGRRGHQIRRRHFTRLQEAF